MTARAAKVKISEAHVEGIEQTSELLLQLRETENVTGKVYGLGMSESSGLYSRARGNGSSQEGCDMMDIDV